MQLLVQHTSTALRRAESAQDKAVQERGRSRRLFRQEERTASALHSAAVHHGVRAADEVAEAPWSVAEWAVALRFDHPRASVPVLLLGDTPLRVFGFQAP